MQQNIQGVWVLIKWVRMENHQFGHWSLNRLDQKPTALGWYWWAEEMETAVAAGRAMENGRKWTREALYF